MASGAYEVVCTRADPLTLGEEMKLGVEDTMRLSAARGDGTGEARHDKKYLTGDLDEIFRLGKPSDNMTFMDGEEDAVKVLEARTESLASPILLGNCHMNRPESGYADWERCGSCGGCKPESNEQRGKREAKEEKERQLGDVNARLHERRQELVGNLVGRQARMESLFRYYEVESAL